MRSIALIFALTAVTSLHAQPAPAYHVTNTYLLGGDGSWEYIVPDPPHHRLFIARQDRVMVIDEDSGKLLGEVTGIQGLRPGVMPGLIERYNGQRVVSKPTSRRGVTRCHTQWVFRSCL
jgi:hypothetical protein